MRSQIGLLVVASGLVLGCGGSDDYGLEPQTVRPRLTLTIEHLGIGADPDGYWVRLDDRDSVRTQVGLIATRSWVGLDQGQHQVVISDVDPSCSADGPLTVPFEVGTADVELRVGIRCSLAEYFQGAELLLARWGWANGPQRLELVSDAGLAHRSIELPGEGSYRFGAWSPDGSRMAIVRTLPGAYGGPSDTVAVVGLDGGSPELYGAGAYIGGVTWSREGGLIFAAYGGDHFGSGLYRGVAGGAAVHLGVPGWAPSWSPEGTRLAVVRVGFRVDLLGGDGTTLRNLSAMGDHPIWSPDGTRLATGSGGILVTPLEEGSLPIRLTGLGADADDYPVAWSADGRYVLFVSADSWGGCTFWDECFTSADLFSVAVDPPYQVRRMTWLGDVEGAWFRPGRASVSR